jgi:hypothetical protein
MKPNPRYEGKGKKRELVGWDVGPMQLATNVWFKSPFTDGLNDPMGTISMDVNTQQYNDFNGDFADNVTLAARAFSQDILPKSSSLADAAGLYRAGSRSPSSYGIRSREYTAESGADRTQLDCLAAARRQ